MIPGVPKGYWTGKKLLVEYVHAHPSLLFIVFFCIQVFKYSAYSDHFDID